MRLCKCKCGGEIPKEAHHSTLYLPGHKPEGIPITYLLGRVCKCKCGTPVSDRSNTGYIHGHRRAELEKMECTFCDCGCGEKCTRPDQRFIHGHNSKTEEGRKEISNFHKERWKDEELREAKRQEMIEYWKNNPEKMEQVAQSIKQHYINHPETRKIVGDKSREMWESEEFREKYSIMMNDPEFKERMSIAMKEGWTEEARLKSSIYNKSKWTPEKKAEQRERYYEQIKNNPMPFYETTKAKLSARSIKCWQNPDYRANMINKLLEYYSDPKNIAKISGPNAPNWQGGIGENPYCCEFTEPYKREIREWDNEQCRNPYCWKTSEFLVVHHINYDKKNCHPLNVITVCNSCNARANYHRSYWRRFYSRIRRLDIEQFDEDVIWR